MSPSMVALTVPSMAFSIGHEAEVDLPLRHRLEHGGDRAQRPRSAPARSGWVRSASWVKVAAGPK